MPTTKIFVGNLSSDTTGDDLRPLFEQYGEVTESDVLRNFGFVHMSNEDEANEAIFQLSGTVVKGQRINVEKSTGGGAPRGGRGGGKMMGGGFRGRGSSRGAPGGRGRGRDYDSYPPPRPSPYTRDPYYDYYERPYPGERLPPPRLPPYPEDRLAMYEREDRLRRRDPYDPYPPPPPRYADSYYDRYPPPRSAADPYERPPPHYYRAYDGYDDPVSRRPPPPEDPLPPGRGREVANGYEPQRREPQPPQPPGDSYSSSYSSYYDRFYNKAPANGDRAGPGAGRPLPQGRGGAPVQGLQRKDPQSALKAEPIYF